MSPTIKKEPGTEDSPRALAQIALTPSGAKKRTRSDSHSGSERASPSKRKGDARRERLKASDVWQYLMNVTSNAFDLPRGFTNSEYMRKIVGIPRKRDLHAIWITRLASEQPNTEILKIVIAYLVGDDADGYLCNSKAANCAAQYQALTPALVSWEVGKQEIPKACAFNKCVLYPEMEDYNNFSGKRMCCNQVYRDLDERSMPEVWSPPDPVHTDASNSGPAPKFHPTPTPAPSAKAVTELPTNTNPETPSHQPHYGARAQEENGASSSHWEQQSTTLYLHGPGNGKPSHPSFYPSITAFLSLRRSLTTSQVPASHAHSAAWLHQRQGEVCPIGADSATLQFLDLPSLGATVALPSNSQNLVCIVHEGTVEVILENCPVFSITRGGQWSVGVGKECRVRNPHIGTKAILYNVGIPVRNQE